MARDPVRGQRILAVSGVAQGHDVEQIQRPVDAPHRFDPRPGRLDGVLPEWELVELPDSIPAALAERVEELERFDEVHGADHNAYYEMQDSLVHPNSLPRSTGPMGWVVRGPWAVTQLADLMYSSKQAPFLVTETNAGSIGFSSMNQSPYDGQWRQLAWLLGARGARPVEDWDWNT